MMLLLLGLAGLLVVNGAPANDCTNGIKYTACPGSLVQTGVCPQITGCDANGCKLTQGNNYDLTLRFTPKNTMNTVAIKAFASFWGSTLPINLPKPDGCQESGLTCPVAGGTEVAYKTTIPIDFTIPTTDMKVRVQMTDQTGADELCGDVDVTIVSPDQ